MVEKNIAAFVIGLIACLCMPIIGGLMLAGIITRAEAKIVTLGLAAVMLMSWYFESLAKRH